MGTWERQWEHCRERRWEHMGTSLGTCRPYGNVLEGTCAFGEACIWEHIMLAILKYVQATIT